MKKHLMSLPGRAYYLTANSENGHHAMDQALAYDVPIAVLFPKDLPAPSDAIVLVCDLNNLGLDAYGRRQMVSELLTRPPKVMTFLHSYDFEVNEPEGKNLVMTRRFDSHLVGRLVEFFSAVIAGNKLLAWRDGEITTIEDDELARIRLGSDGCPLCD